MDFRPDPPLCKPAQVRSQNSCRVIGDPDSEAGLNRLPELVLHRMSARLALLGHVLGLGAPAQTRPAIQREWQSEP